MHVPCTAIHLFCTFEYRNFFYFFCIHNNNNNMVRVTLYTRRRTMDGRHASLSHSKTIIIKKKKRMMNINDDDDWSGFAKHVYNINDDRVLIIHRGRRRRRWWQRSFSRISRDRVNWRIYIYLRLICQWQKDVVHQKKKINNQKTERERAS